MTDFKVVMPKLGESIQEATITRWFVRKGDIVREDTLLFEVATDKVDSEIPSPVSGVIADIFYPENAIVPVGEVVAVIVLQDENSVPVGSSATAPQVAQGKGISFTDYLKAPAVVPENIHDLSNRFYSPLVKKIAAEEHLSLSELESIAGSGAGGRVQKKDILEFMARRGKQVNDNPEIKAGSDLKGAVSPANQADKFKVSLSIGAEDQVIEMDRVRKLIAGHMVMSKQVSPHVTTVVEADVTNLVLWRNRVKDDFLARYNEKLTFMPVFIEAVSRALREYPMVNASVDGERIILRKHINIGIAVARPDGNLIVPVIKDADEKNLNGLVKNLNQLAEAARTNKLNPEDIRDGSFSITNFGSFRNLIGTPIIHQPQAAILATGSIEKKPAVLELPSGDVIAIRHKMFLSLSFDHRIIDGALGGAFLRRIADILEDFDLNRSI